MPVYPTLASICSDCICSVRAWKIFGVQSDSCFFYLACGVGAAALSLLMQLSGYGVGPALGASGAVMGVVVAYAYLFPNTEFTGLYIPIPIKAKWLAIIYVAGDLFGGFSRVSDGIGHFAHLGGALTGFIIVLIWNKTNRKTFY